MREPSETAAGGVRPWGHLGVALAAGVVIGFLGPFGTYASLPLGWRITYWSAMLLAGTLFFPTFYMFVRHRLEPRGVPAWAYIPLVVLVGSVPMCAMVVGITQLLLRDPMSVSLDLYLYVVAIALPMVAIKHLLITLRARQAAAPAVAPAVSQPPTSTEPRLLDRLPPRLGRDLLCLEMEDHYLRVHTARGTDLILLRMRDAVAELDGVDGLQVHRSWWVARHAIVGWRRDGKGATLTLVNGIEVPVARDRMATLRQAGWLSPRAGTPTTA